MPHVCPSHGPSFSEFRNDHVMKPGGGDLFSNDLSGLGLATWGPWSGTRHHHCHTGGRHHDCHSGDGSQQNASIASQLLGLVADANTPEDKAALISAAISLLKSGACHGRHHGSDEVLETLSRVTHQISTSSGLSECAKDRILDGIAKLVKLIASSANRHHGTNNNILNNLNQLINRISHASGLDQATKNHILDELAGIVQQLTHSGSSSSGCRHPDSDACDAGNDHAAASGTGDLDAA
jgi:hypothetical protein